MNQRPENSPSADTPEPNKNSRLRVFRCARFYLVLVLVLFVAAGVDSCREPPNQVTVRIYRCLVQGYQWVGRPAVAGICQCRFEPSCSQYSVEAVERFGIRKGLWLTVRRVSQCTNSVSLGTRDPVPKKSRSLSVCRPHR